MKPLPALCCRPTSVLSHHPCSTVIFRCLCCCCTQILLMMRQMDAAGTQALASNVSLVALGQQAIMDAHLCLLHVTTGAALACLGSGA